MKRTYKILSLLLAAVLVFTAVPAVRADEGGVTCTEIVYGTSVNGRDLTCYVLTDGEEYSRTLLLNFAIHGYEDAYDADGQVLVDFAERLIGHYSRQTTLHGCRLIVVPCANPDGLLDGNTSYGFGRCNADGIDLNRDFDAGHYPFQNARNYTPAPFSGVESRALRDLYWAYQPDVVIDFHGWYNEVYGGSATARKVSELLGLPYIGNLMTRSGFFARWAQAQGSVGMLVELPAPDDIPRRRIYNAIDWLLTDTEACPGKQFVDMPYYNDWAHAGIVYMLQKGWMNGISGTQFAPEDTMTRAMVVTALWRMAGQPAPTGEAAFTDVPDGAWYTEAVLWAAENGVVTGVGNSRFDPEDYVTREQLAAILYRYAALQGKDCSFSMLPDFPDAASASDWAEEALAWAATKKLLNGTVIDGTVFLRPGDSATRAQIAAILMRYDEMN